MFGTVIALDGATFQIMLIGRNLSGHQFETEEPYPCTPGRLIGYVVGGDSPGYPAGKIVTLIGEVGDDSIWHEIEP